MCLFLDRFSLERVTPIKISAEAFEKAVHAFGPSIYRLAVNQLGSASAAEDVFQDTFEALCRTNTSFNDAEHLKAWLLRVAINRCKNVKRSRARQKEQTLDPAHLEGCSTGERQRQDELAREDLASHVDNLLEGLSDDLRVALYLRYIEGYSTEEIAAIEGVTASAIRSRIHRARHQLKRNHEKGWQ